MAFYYDGKHEGRSSETGWWLVDVLKTTSKKFPLTITFKFVDVDRTDYTFKLHEENYIKTIDYDSRRRYTFASWSFNLMSPLIRNAVQVNKISPSGNSQSVHETGSNPSMSEHTH